MADTINTCGRCKKSGLKVDIEIIGNWESFNLPMNFNEKTLTHLYPKISFELCKTCLKDLTIWYNPYLSQEKHKQ